MALAIVTTKAMEVALQSSMEKSPFGDSVMIPREAAEAILSHAKNIRATMKAITEFMDLDVEIA